MFCDVVPSSETQGRLVTRGNKSGKEMSVVNLRRFISLPDLFPLAQTNRPWVFEDDVILEVM